MALTTASYGNDGDDAYDNAEHDGRDGDVRRSAEGNSGEAMEGRGG